MDRARILVVALIASTISITGAAPSARAVGYATTVRSSVGGTGEVDGASTMPDVSDDGDVVFASRGTSFGDDADANEANDVFLRTGSTTLLISRGGRAGAGNGASDAPVISGDGRYVAFRSDASNLVEGDTNGVSDVFVYDRDVNADGLDGEDTSLTLASATGEVIGNGASDQPAISSDGAYVAFRTAATNLVEGDTNGVTDVIVRTVAGGALVRVSTDPTGREGNGPSGAPAVASDGTTLSVAFETDADDLVVPDDGNARRDIVLWRRPVAGGTVTTELVSVDGSEDQLDADSFDPSISETGMRIVFRTEAADAVAGDTNGRADVFLRGRATMNTIRVSVASGGTQADGMSDQPAISDDGTLVAFRSWATNLAAGDTNDVRDVFVHTISGTTTQLVSRDSASALAGDRSHEPSLSDDGTFVVFSSAASNLVAGDANGDTDVFRREVDLLPPLAPTATPDAQHVAGSTAWGTDRTIDVEIAGADDPTAPSSGVDGYSYLWDQAAGTVPDTTKDAEESLTEHESPTLPTGDNYFHIRAVDNAGNWGPTTTIGFFRIDGTGPSVSFPTPGGTEMFRLGSVLLDWSATDAQSGVANYDVYYRRAKYNRATNDYEAEVLWKNAIVGSSATFTGSKGYTYKIRVVACDNAGNTSTSVGKKITFPADDTSMTRTPAAAWTTLNSANYYGGEASRGFGVGTYLRLPVKYLASGPNRIVVVATTCSGCGGFRIYVNNVAVGPLFSTGAASTSYQQQFVLPVIGGTPANVNVDVRHAGGGQIRIEGVGVHRTG